MLDDLRGLLMALGMTSKEADVYLAMLELGPTSIQSVSEKANVNRSTTYVQLESLMEKGLASSYDRMGKTYYVAEHPDRLQSMVGKQLADAEIAKRQIEDGLPKLKAIFHAIPGKPLVRFAEGGESIVHLREELLALQEPLLIFCAVDQDLVKSAEIQADHRKRLTSQLHGSKFLFAIKPGFVPPYFDHSIIEARETEYERRPFSGELIITSGKVIWVNQKQQAASIVIEHPEFTATMRGLYLEVWEKAKAWVPPIDWGK